MGEVMSKWLRYVVVGLLSTGLMCTGSALAWADGEIMLDLVRHGQSTANAAGIIDTVPPGTDLDAAGVHQADEIAALIQGEYGSSIANVVASDEARAVQTAAPLADLLHISNPVDQLSGLNEIPAGAFEGAQTNSLEGILYLLGPLSWAFGLDLVPDLGYPASTASLSTKVSASQYKTSTTAPRARPAPRPMSHSPARERSLSGR